MKIKTMFNLEEDVVNDLDVYANKTMIYKSKLVNKLLRDFLDKNLETIERNKKEVSNDIR